MDRSASAKKHAGVYYECHDNFMSIYLPFNGTELLLAESSLVSLKYRNQYFIVFNCKAFEYDNP